MKKLSIIFLSTLIAAAAGAQTKGKPATAPVKKTLPAAKSTQPILANLTDSASFAIGQNIALAVTADLKNLNKEAFLHAIKNVFDGKGGQFSEDTSRMVLMRFSQQEKEAMVKANIDEGRAFLENNKKNPNVKITASGLQYEVVKEGTGEKPTADDEVVCHYTGTLIDGTQFDNSHERGAPLTVRVSGVIKGWTEGLQLMTVGSIYKFYVPYELGYDLRGAGNDIPGGAALIFEIELLEIKK